VSAQPDAAARLRVEPSVVRDLVRLAALDVPGVVRVGRGGPRIVRRLAADPVAVQVRDGRADVRLRITAAAGSSLPALARDVRTAAAGAVERLLGLDAADVVPDDWVSLPVMIVLLATAIGFSVLMSLAALLAEEYSYRRYRGVRSLLVAAWAAVEENIGYRQLTAWWRLRGSIDALRGSRHEWGDMKRTGFGG